MSVTISATLVKELRERTSAGMMECKRALEQAAGDIELAIDNMRKSGQAKADKKSSRTAAEGLVAVQSSADNRTAVMVEINSETDFVSRDSNFIEFCKNVAAAALANKTSSADVLLHAPYQAGLTVEDARKALVLKIGENIVVRRVVVKQADKGVIGTYVHGGRIGVMVTVTTDDVELAKDLAMHVAANNPVMVRPEDCPADVLAKEKEIFAAQVQESGKPANIAEKILEGKVKKFLEESSLLGQPFVKDPDISVAQLLKEKQSDVVSFERYRVGDGIEKEVSNFVEEVMAQVRTGA